MTTTALFDDRTAGDLGSGPRLPAIAAPETLSDLIGEFEASAAQRHPDVDVPVRSLKMDDCANIVVPGVGPCAPTAWAKSQLASRLGIRWDKWFDGIDGRLRADEVNRRLARDEGTIRLKTSAGSDQGAAILRGIVSTSYSTIADAAVAQAILEELRAGDPRLVRHTTTDRTSSYVVQVGAPLRLTGPAVVGDVRGGILVRNSDVGYASLLIQLHMTRCICSNGMVVEEDQTIIHRAHRRIDLDVLQEKLAVGLQNLPSRLQRAGRALENAGHHAVADIEGALVDVLRLARLPLRLLPVMLGAYEREPHPSVHGVTQAITLGAQHASVSAEHRLSLEQAAGQYIRRFAGS